MRKNLLLLFFTLLFIYGALEAALRIIGFDAPKLPQKPKSDWALVPERIWTEHDPQLGWVHQKHKRAVLKIDYGEIELQTNSLGLRGTREYAKERPEGVQRVVVLGDSFVFGWGVKDSETFTAQLEGRKAGLEVMNLGVPGYGIDQIYLTYKNMGREFRPDYVFIGIFPEDFWRATRAFADTGHAKPYFKLSRDGALKLQNTPVPQPFTLRTNQFPELIEYGPVESVFMNSIAYRFMKRKIIKLGKNFGWADPESSEEWLLGRAILKQLIREIQADGAKPVLLIIPPERWMGNSKPDSLHKSLLRFADREKVDLIDLTPKFIEAVKTSGVNEYYIPSDRHWTVKGHGLASQTIAAFLLQQGYAV
jgi:hypothetical protein